MKMKTIFFSLPLFVLVLAGCQTTKMDAPSQPISWRTREAYLNKIRDPRIFGLGIYQTPAGVQIRGGGRLHPSQAGAFSMKAEAPWRPVVGLTGNFGTEWPVLLDVTSSRTWLEFSTAQKLRATPVGERDPVFARWGDDEAGACLSTISSLRLGQIHIENPLLYVRLAEGSLGQLTRGIDDRGLRGVVGWGALKKFEQIQFLYSCGQVALFTTEPYSPDPGFLLATLPLVEHVGVCAVRGTIDGREGMILIDPAGDFELAVPGGGAVSSVRLGVNLTFESPVVSDSPGGVRIGARLLQNYRVTLAPLDGVIHIEEQISDRAE